VYVVSGGTCDVWSSSWIICSACAGGSGDRSSNTGSDILQVVEVVLCVVEDMRRVLVLLESMGFWGEYEKLAGGRAWYATYGRGG